MATGFLRAGFPRAQTRLTDAILDEEPPSDVAAAHFMGRAFAWASRGAWDSALVATRQWVRLSDDPDAALQAYGLATMGVWLGTVLPTEAGEVRPAALRALDRPTVNDLADHRAVIAWLDGLIAFSRSDSAALADAAAAIRSSGSRNAGVLARSLAAFALHQAGRTAEAARLLAAFEWERAERQGHVAYGPLNPYLSTVHRLAAGRWLLAAGDTTQAARLLTWHEAILGGEAMRVETVNRTFEPLAQFHRARIAESLGRAEEARRRYRLFLDRYDLPPPGHREWVGHAGRTVAALSAAGDER